VSALLLQVCGHRWGDLSGSDYGAALLNDCKYGYSCRGGRLSLSLLRAPKAPDELADMGAHAFQYSLLPHLGSVTASDAVVSAGLLLNAPVLRLPGSPVQPVLHSQRCAAIAARAGCAPSASGRGAAPWASLCPPSEFRQLTAFSVRAASADCCSAADSGCSIILDTVKAAEDGSGDIILRLNEALGWLAARARIDVGFAIGAVEVTYLRL
jgi:alpha-mannosidase